MREETRGAASASPIVRSRSTTPATSWALNDVDSDRSERLPANLIQGLRDLFGAHTYKRIDDPESSFHVLWSGDRSEVVS